MNKTTVELNINNLSETYIFDKVAKQASGAVMYKQKDAVLLAVVTMDDTPANEDFLPLTVQYVEKAYAAAKIPGGFMKREGKPGDFEVLTSRIVDRSLRSLFPKGFHNPVSITITVVSTDSTVDMQLAALHAANAALFVSGVPVQKSISAVRISSIDGEMLANLPLDRQSNSQLDLMVVGSHEGVITIEMGAISTQADGELQSNACSDDSLVELISQATGLISDATKQYESNFAPFVATPKIVELKAESIDKEIYKILEENYQEKTLKILQDMAKSERSNSTEMLVQEIESELKDQGISIESDQISAILKKYTKTLLRDMIVNQRTRADGRGLEDVRGITIETNLLPSAHGSCLFTRGQTQALAVATLGDKKDSQMYELITSKSTQSENFMVHYNFPPYSVGETRPIGAPSRRELGHGNLAKKAIQPVLENLQGNTVRLVSEILESNGSSSMATVCGGSLALKAAKVPMRSLVAGVAMGLVIDTDGYAILTDISGLEDQNGDMDLKVAGTKDGTTAMQMDIKLGGVSPELLKEALDRATKAKLHILKQMEQASSTIVDSTALPSVVTMKVDPSHMGAIIGKGGSVIREMIETHGVDIDLNRDSGDVKITGSSQQNVDDTRDQILSITSTPVQKQMTYDIGVVYEGTVKRIVDFGLFVEMPDGFDALLHISKISKERTSNISELYKEGEKIEVVVLEQEGKKVELATKSYSA